MKKIISILAFVLVLTFAFSVFADYKTVEVYVNGEVLVSDSPAVLVGSRTMVPLRAISEKLGCEVGWDDSTRTAEIKNSKTAVYVTIDSDVMVKKSLAEGKSEEIKIDAPAMLYKSRTLIPLRAVSEALDAKVDWNAEKECALITTDSHNAYYGVVTKTGYVSDELKLKFVAPEGSEISYKPQNIKVSEWADDVETVEEELVSEFSAIFSDTGSNITFAVGPKTSVTVTDYLEFVREYMEGNKEEYPYTIEKEIKKFDFAGYPFERFELSTTSEGEVLDVRYCAGKINDRLVVMVVVCGEGNQVNASEFMCAFSNIN